MEIALRVCVCVCELERGRRIPDSCTLYDAYHLRTWLTNFVTLTLKLEANTLFYA